MEKDFQKVCVTGLTLSGSGKTESFMIPIINELLSERDRGTLSPGVRTMIIYPMNALVNDQIRRLRELLGNMSGQQITYGRFTGETKESYTEARRKFIELEGEGTLPDNELISREQMRNTPPNILITNYAMLEYMLLRPGDNIIFSSDNSQMWKYIVFDEAHSYTGAKGIEVSALIRRVKAMLQRDDIRFILTSATLGDEKSNSEIVRFGESLCSAPFDANSIIRSETEQAKPEREVVENSIDLYTALAKCIKENEPEDVIKKTLSTAGVTVPESQTTQEVLYDVILHDKFYYRVRSVLYSQILSVSEAASQLNISKTQFTDFIAVASNAIKNDQRLFEAKYHMFLRGIEGVYVTLPPSNKLFTRKMQTYIENKDDPEGSTFQVYEVSFCSNCNALYITGDTQTNPGYLTQKPKYSEGYEPEVFLLSGDYDEEESDDADNENMFQICAKCGAIKHATSVTGLQCGHGSEYISKLIRVKGPHETLHQCPCCHSRNAQRSIACEYCHTKGNGQCVQKDDMQNIYQQLQEAEMLVIASPIYYHGLSGQLKCTIDRFYAAAYPNKPPKLKKVAMFLSSGDPDMYDGALFSYQGDFLDYLQLEGMGVFTTNGYDPGVPGAKLEELRAFGASLE